MDFIQNQKFINNILSLPRIPANNTFNFNKPEI
jgi:hypothetical protein